MGTPADSERTRNRIIEVAGQLFAEHGCKAVTIRAIAALAETHLSAVNYHFASKDALYVAVIRAALNFTADDAAQLRQLPDDPTSAEEALVQLIRSLLKLQASDQGTWRQKLLARECLEPTPALKDEVNQSYRPLFDTVQHLLQAAMPSHRIEPGLLQLHTFLLLVSLDGLFNYHELITAIVPELAERLTRTDELAEQLVGAALRGLQNCGSTSEAATNPKSSKQLRSNTRSH